MSTGVGGEIFTPDGMVFDEERSRSNCSSDEPGRRRSSELSEESFT